MKTSELPRRVGSVAIQPAIIRTVFERQRVNCRLVDCVGAITTWYPMVVDLDLSEPDACRVRKSHTRAEWAGILAEGGNVAGVEVEHAARGKPERFRIRTQSWPR